MFADRSSILCVFLLLIRIPSTDAELGIDMFFLLHENAQKEKYMLDGIVNGVKGNMTKVFQIGPTKTRVAFVMNERNTWKHIGLAGDTAKLESNVDQIKAGAVDFMLDTGMKKASIALPIGTRRARVIVLLTSPDQGDMKTAVDEAKRLREDGVVIVALYFFKGIDAKKDESFLNDIHAIVGNPNNSIKLVQGFYNDFPKKEIFDQLKNTIEKQLCIYRPKCFYLDDQKQCEKQWYTPSVPIDGGDCSSITKPPADQQGSCDTTECENTCTSMWPWKDAPTCTKKNCGQKSGKRLMTYRWSNLKFCPTERVCPPCGDTGGSTNPPTTEKPSQAILALVISIPLAAIVVICAAVLAYLVVKRGSFRFRKRKDKPAGVSGKRPISKKGAKKEKVEETNEDAVTEGAEMIKSVTTKGSKKEKESPDTGEEAEEEDGKKSKSSKKKKGGKGCKIKRSKSKPEVDE